MSPYDPKPYQHYRGLNLFGLLCCVGALGFAIGYLQHTAGLAPCPLCLVSRLLVVAVGLLFLLAWLHNPRQLGQRGYALLGGLTSLVGIGLNLRHIWLQSLPVTNLADCGPGPDYLLQNAPLQHAIGSLLNGSGACSKVQWQQLGLTLPQWTLLLFLLLLIVQMVQFRKKRARSYFK